MKDELVGERLRNERKAADMTQAELGALLGISGSAVGQWEQGRTSPSWRQQQRLRVLFGMADEPAPSDDVASLAARVHELMDVAESNADVFEELTTNARAAKREQEALRLLVEASVDRLVTSANEMVDALEEMRGKLGRIERFVDWREASLLGGQDGRDEP